MMLHDDETRLKHMLDYSRKAIAMIEGIDRREFSDDEMRCLALTRLLEVIGEAAAGVTQTYRQQHDKIPWAQIISLRNRLIHGCFSVDLDILWNIIEQDIPALIDALQEIVDP